MKPLAAWKKQAKALYAGGRRLAYWTARENDETKPWLLLLHGYPTSSWDWSFLWRDLSQNFRLAALDMLGFGLSEKPRDAAYSIFDQADFQEALLEQLVVSEAHILAHDYGDTVAQELLARHNEGSLSFSVKSVVFLNGGLFPEEHRARPIQKFGLTPFGFLIGVLMSENSLRAAFDDICGPDTKPSKEEIATHWSLICEGGGRFVMHKLLRYIPERKANRARWVGALVDAKVPLRLIDGGADPVSGAHMARRYQELVPDADAVMLDDVGHYPHTEAQGDVFRRFMEFHQRMRTLSE
jgi:pimeloyl-ACP methyl ester carboxylesterase